MGMDISSAAMNATQNGPINAPIPTADVAKAKKTAQDFEGVFLTQMLSQMFSGLSTDGPFGGGQGESMFRSLMLDEYGKQIAAQGGIGIASKVTAELLKHQETASSDKNTATANQMTGQGNGAAAAQAYGAKETKQ